MAKYDMPTARYRSFNNHQEAKQHLEKVQYNIVTKATDVAAGKGVILPTSKIRAQDALKKVR